MKLLKMSISKDFLIQRQQLENAWAEELILAPVPNGSKAVRRGLKYTMLPYLRNFRTDQDGSRHRALLAYPSRQPDATAFINVLVRHPKIVEYTSEVAQVRYYSKSDSYKIIPADKASHYSSDIMAALIQTDLKAFGEEHFFESEMRTMVDAMIVRASLRMFSSVYLCSDADAERWATFRDQMLLTILRGSFKLLSIDLDNTVNNREAFIDLAYEQIKPILDGIVERCEDPGPNVEKLEQDIIGAEERIKILSEVMETPAFPQLFERRIFHIYNLIDTLYEKEKQA